MMQYYANGTANQASYTRLESKPTTLMTNRRSWISMIQIVDYIL